MEDRTFAMGYLVEQRQTYDRPLCVELTRGARGVYRWSIKFHGHSGAEALDLIRKVDRELFQAYVVMPMEAYGEDTAYTD